MLKYIFKNAKMVYGFLDLCALKSMIWLKPLSRFD